MKDSTYDQVLGWWHEHADGCGQCGNLRAHAGDLTLEQLYNHACSAGKPFVLQAVRKKAGQREVSLA